MIRKKMMETGCQIIKMVLRKGNLSGEGQAKSCKLISGSFRQHFALNCLTEALICYNKSKSMQNYVFFHQVDDCKAKEEGVSNAGSWALEENLSYAIFVDIHKKQMTSKKKMRQMQFYDKLSAFIGSRSPSQCRSHHQKMFDKFKYISKIVETFKIEVGLAQYKAKFQEGIQKMKEINLRFNQEQSGRVTIDTHSEFRPVLLPSELNNNFLITTAIPQIPLFYNNFYVFGGDYQLGAVQPPQNFYICPDY